MSEENKLEAECRTVATALVGDWYSGTQRELTRFERGQLRRAITAELLTLHQQLAQSQERVKELEADKRDSV